MFLPTTAEETAARGWDRPDVVLVTGDAYVDSPHFGAALVGRVLEAAGFRVGIIAQPDLDGPADITRLGVPRLFWGVTGGCVDSMVANTTATGRRRRSDDFTPGGTNTRRPDRAVIAYTNLIKRHVKHGPPVVLGGLEASLRRISHYDFWSDRVRRSILVDAKADYLVYGMAERTAVDLARALAAGGDPRRLRGLCHLAPACPQGYLQLPPHRTVAADKSAFAAMFQRFYEQTDPVVGRGLCQLQDTRYLVQNPPAAYLDQAALDAVYELPFTREVHPFDRARGEVRALETVRCALTAHRGCYGECRFCAIAVHQGRTVRWRSEASLLREARRLTRHPAFAGVITDVGGPSANMYGFECARKATQGACRQRHCLHPRVCPHLPVTHAPQVRLLQRLRRLPGVRRVFVGSGLRYDLLLADDENGPRYLRELAAHHVSGQLKVAPEHTDPALLELMGKPSVEALLTFKRRFDAASRAAGKRQFLTYYFILLSTPLRGTFRLISPG